VHITVPYSVLLGHRAPCEVAGYGPVCTEQALPLIGTGDLYRMLTDPVSGQLLDYGRTRYRPPPHLSEFVKTRDGECPLPSCHHDTRRAEVDHIVPARPDPVTGLPTHGSTSAENLAAVCPHHHHGKDAGRGFTLHRASDGTFTWTTPLGRAYTPQPDALWHPDTDQCPLVTTDDDWADGFADRVDHDHIDRSGEGAVIAEAMTDEVGTTGAVGTTGIAGAENRCDAAVCQADDPPPF
jgi:hypothetical protein